MSCFIRRVPERPLQLLTVNPTLTRREHWRVSRRLVPAGSRSARRRGNKPGDFVIKEDGIKHHARACSLSAQPAQVSRVGRLRLRLEGQDLPLTIVILDEIASRGKVQGDDRALKPFAVIEHL